MPIVKKVVGKKISAGKKHTLHSIVGKPLLVDLGGGNFLDIKHLKTKELSSAKD